MMTPRRTVQRLAVAGALAVGLTLPAASAFADGTGQCPTASPSDTTCEPTTTPSTASGSGAVAGATATAPRKTGGGLPVTGADIAGLVVIGGGALTAGSVLVYRSRRHS